MNKPLSNVNVIAIACCLLSLPSANADDRTELVSYLDAYEANWTAIQTMDVFCRTDQMREPGVEPGFTETTFERLAFDSIKDRYMYAKTIERRMLDKDEIAESIETGFVIKDGMYRSFAPGKRLLPPRPIDSREQVFDEHRMPDWRIIILMKQSWGSSYTWTQNRANAIQVLPQLVSSVKKLGSSQDTVTFETFGSNGAGRQYVFRDEDLMPSKVVWLVKGDADTTMDVGREHYQWRRANKVLVPDTVEGTYRERQFRMKPAELEKLDLPNMTPDEIKQLYVDLIVHRDMQFTWLEVNTTLADQLFDYALIDDPARFTALCAPTVAATANPQE
jgi:hypothetical protein